MGRHVKDEHCTVCEGSIVSAVVKVSAVEDSKCVIGLRCAQIIGSGLRANIETHAELLTRIWICSLFALVVCAVVQLYFLHSTLANSPVSYGVPTYQTLLTLLTIISGGTFFSEFK